MQQSTSQTVVRGKERKRLTESGNKRKCKDCKSKQASAWGSMTAIAFHIWWNTYIQQYHIGLIICVYSCFEDTQKELRADSLTSECRVPTRSSPVRPATLPHSRNSTHCRNERTSETASERKTDKVKRKRKTVTQSPRGWVTNMERLRKRKQQWYTIQARQKLDIHIKNTAVKKKKKESDWMLEL